MSEQNPCKDSGFSLKYFAALRGLFLCALLALMLLPGTAQAAIPSIQEACTNSTVVGSGTFVEPYTIDASKGFTNRIVGCIENILLAIGEEEFGEIRDQIKNIVVALLTLYIVILGYQVVLGYIHNATADGMVRIFKILVVVFFTLNSGLEMVFPIVKATQEGFVTLITEKTLGVGGGGAGDDMCTGGSEEPEYNVWNRMDCTIAKLLGAGLDADLGAGADLAFESFKESTIKSPYTFGSTIIGLLFSGVGVIVALFGMVTIGMIILAFATAVVLYVMSLVAIVVLMLIAPIVIPAILFESTKNFFDQWFQALISYIFQPVILFGYLAFMTVAMNFVLNGTGNEFKGMLNIMEQTHELFQDDDVSLHCIVSSTITEVKDSAAVAGDEPADQKHTDALSGAVTIPCITVQEGMDHQQGKLNDQQVAEFTTNLLALMMIVAVLFSFMMNVMRFGAQLAGIPYQFSLGQYSSMFSSSMGAGAKIVGGAVK